MHENKYKIGTILREHRLEHHLTQEQLAEMIDITPGFLGQIERDETYPSIDNLAKIIQALNIDANIMFHPYEKGAVPETDISLNEIKFQFPKLKKENQEILITLMRKLAELQNKYKE